MIDKATTEASLKELQEFFIAHPDTKYVDAICTDLCGIVRGKRYPRNDVEKLYRSGLQLPYSVFFLDVTGASADPCGRGFSDGDPDGTCFPIPGTLVPAPWADEPAGQVLMTMYDSDGSPAMVDPRHLLAAVDSRLQGLGLKAVVAFELEFYLLDQARDGDGRPQPPVSPLTASRDSSTQVYGMNELDGFAPFFRDIEAAGRRQRIPASVATAEYSPGQYEVNLRHVDSPLVAADHCALLRHLVKSIARTHGMQATLMSKPFLDCTGNGMHIHVSVLDGQGSNVFDDGSEAGSETLRHAVGGMIATMADAMAIFAPNVNAFRRYGPRLYVPVTKSWGANNRSVAFRIPAGSPDNRRIEHRIAGAEANPYLVLAVALASIHHGISNRIDPGPPWPGSACNEVDADLPLDWGAALDRLRQSKLLKWYLGEEYVELYCETKRAEMAGFLNHISPREYAWYL